MNFFSLRIVIKKVVKKYGHFFYFFTIQMIIRMQILTNKYIVKSIIPVIMYTRGLDKK